MPNTLFIGPKNYSSWSLRPWLVLKWGGIEFTEHPLSLNQPGYGVGEIEAVKRISPGGTVPALHVDELVIWDSLAICEWAAEQSSSLWPNDPNVRAQGRSATAEMHSGFSGLRRDMPMNIHRRCDSPTWPEDTQRNLGRLFELWHACRDEHAAGGPWLFGERSIADAFYAPVATRLRTYSVSLDAVCQHYVDTIFDDNHFKEWEQASTTGVWDKAGYPVIDKLHQ